MVMWAACEDWGLMVSSRTWGALSTEKRLPMGCRRAVWESVPTRCASTVAPVSRVTRATPVTVHTHLSEDGIVGEVRDVWYHSHCCVVYCTINLLKVCVHCFLYLTEVGVNLLKEYMIKYEFSAEQGLSATDFMHVRVGFTTKKKQGILLQLQDATNTEYISLEINNAGTLQQYPIQRDHCLNVEP